MKRPWNELLLVMTIWIESYFFEFVRFKHNNINTKGATYELELVKPGFANTPNLVYMYFTTIFNMSPMRFIKGVTLTTEIFGG